MVNNLIATEKCCHPSLKKAQEKYQHQKGTGVLNTPNLQHFHGFPFDETISATFKGYHRSSLRLFCFYLTSFMTGGVIYLFGRWFAKFQAWATGYPCELFQATDVLVTNSFDQDELVEVTKEELAPGLDAEELFTENKNENMKSASSLMSPPQSDTDLTKIASNSSRSFLTVLDYKCNRFLLNPSSGQFVATWEHSHPIPQTVVATELPLILSELERGVPETMLSHQRAIYGLNFTDIASKSVFQVFMDVVLHPFNVFQIAGVIIWSCEDYYSYAAIITLLTLISVITSMIEYRTNTERLRSMAHFECSVNVLRDGQWNRTSSLYLVPGDIVMLEENEAEVTTRTATSSVSSSLPFDACVLAGDALVDECMLTGESIPVLREPIDSLDTLTSVISPGTTNSSSPCTQIGNKHVIFAGTRLIRSRPRDARPPIVLVLRTGFLTAKGSLMQSILFPRPNTFRFYQDSMMFVGTMCIIALIGLLYSFLELWKLKPGWYYIIMKTLDMITVVVPPALHTTTTIGTLFALARLKKKGIYCISPPRINVASRVDTMCFDKTGTLTEEGLDVHGLLLLEQQELGTSSKAEFVGQATKGAIEKIQSSRSLPINLVLGCCHSLQLVDKKDNNNCATGSSSLIGDPLDLKMVHFSGWQPVPIMPLSRGSVSSSTSNPSQASILNMRPPDHSMIVGIIKYHEFNPTLRRMSVVCRLFTDDESDAKTMILCKGSPETIRECCLPSTIPDDYDQVLEKYAHQGYRVLACTAREIPGDGAFIKHVPRAQVESQLHFLGFLVFENRLKMQTVPVIKQLQTACIRTLMVTGDNILTAISVSRECGIVSNSQSVLQTTITQDDLYFKEIVSYQTFEIQVNDKRSSSSSFVVHHWTTILNSYQGADAVIACTGDALEWAMERLDGLALRRLLILSVVYARMSPAQKQTLVELLQQQQPQAIIKNVPALDSIQTSSSEEGSIVGFCGDGANDCGALRAASVGISLSQAEASVAAPFTSRIPSIECVPLVIREGRASLVTSFDAFKFMAMYSMIQFLGLVFLYRYARTLGDWQFLYIDMLMVLPLGLLMTRFGTASDREPLVSTPPTAHLISASVLTSILGQTLLQGIFQTINYLSVIWASNYQKPEIIPDRPNVVSLENTCIFLLNNFLYVNMAVVYCSGKPHRKPFYFPFYGWIVLTTIFNTILLFFSAQTWPWLTGERLELLLNRLTVNTRYFILVLAVSHFVLAIITEYMIFPFIANAIEKRRIRKRMVNYQASAKS